jgi:tripartite motif-containing protein 71
MIHNRYLSVYVYEWEYRQKKTFVKSKMFTCIVCFLPLAKRRCRYTEIEKSFFCSEQCFETYNLVNYQSKSISLLPDDIIDIILIPLIDANCLHLLKVTNSRWRKRIGDYILKAAPKFQFKTKFGTMGDDLGQFNCSLFVSCDKRGNIYVSDSSNHRIQEFTSNGEWKNAVGSCGSMNTQFKCTMGIAFDSKNKMIVADHYNYKLKVFEKMQFANVYARLKFPFGIAVDPEDNVAVVDGYEHHIIIFDSAGNSMRVIGKQGTNDGEFKFPWGIAISKADGRIFVSDSGNHRIQVFSPDGRFLFKFNLEGADNDPHGLVLSNCGKYLLVCDSVNHRIQIFNAMNGSFIKYYGVFGKADGEFDYPCGICVSPLGHFIVCDTYNYRLQIFE